MFPSPSLGPPLLSLSWSPPLCCGMLRVALVDGALGAYAPLLPAALELVLDGALEVVPDGALEVVLDGAPEVVLDGVLE